MHLTSGPVLDHRLLKSLGITDSALIRSYERCRSINARFGKTYYLATLLLPSRKRPFIHALYGFARAVDDIVDGQSGDRSQPQSSTDQGRRLDQIQGRFERDYARGQSNTLAMAAAIHTAHVWGIPRADFDAFFDSMRADLTITRYNDYASLRRYMHGSAAVIGRQLTPILGPTSPDAVAYAEQLGEAFQLANFIRDVGEDLDRGRIYLPLDELARFDVSPAALNRRRVTDDLRSALQFQIDRVGRLSDAAAPGIDLLHPSSRDCVATARTLYCEIADAVAGIDYQVFTQRATVSRRRRLAIALPAWQRAARARRRYGAGEIPS